MKRLAAASMLVVIPAMLFSQRPPAVVGAPDPLRDIPGKEWCYLAKSDLVIGVPFQPDVTQVTYDGAVYTRHAELGFSYGDSHTPIMARQKTFYRGWIPIVQYDWKEDGLWYHIEYFSAPLNGWGVDNTVNFVKYAVRNVGDQPSPAELRSSLCYNSGDYRFAKIEFFPDSMFWATPQTGFSPDWKYEMTNHAAYRSDSLVYMYSASSVVESPRAMSPGSKTCLASYRKLLKPGESLSAIFKMPRVPVGRSDTAYLSALRGADYLAYRKKTVDYWTGLMSGKCDFEIPEARVQHAYRAGVVEALLATRNKDGKKEQTDGLPYPDYFLTSAPETALLYLTAGLDSLPEKYMIPDAIGQQQKDGLYFDQAVAHGQIIPAAHGHILYAMAMSVLFSQDKDFARSIYPSMKRGIGFLKGAIDTSRYGLLPPCYAYDAEMITGYYSGQNFFSLMGLRSSIRVARLLGEDEDAQEWTALAERYERNIRKAVDSSARKDGYIPPGFYHYLTGQSARKGFEEYQTDCDWENIILSYPTEVLAARDPRVSGTLGHVRREYAEGVMTYRHGMFLHQYITSNMIQQYLAEGDNYTALKDFYHQLLHSGSALECFENLVKPWTNREVDPVCPPPHAWGSSKQALTVRNFLLMEYGGRNGMDSGARELWIYPCLSPAWVIPGKHVAIRNAATEFGRVNSTIAFTKNGARASFRSEFHDAPACYRIRVPYFKTLVNFRSDAKTQQRQGDCILLSPDASWLTLEWKDKPGANVGTVADILTEYRGSNQFKGVSGGKAVIETPRPFLLPGEKSDKPQPLSFELVRKTFQYEFDRIANSQKAKPLVKN